MKENMQDAFFKVVDIITEKKISQVEFDRTILCKIVEDKFKKQGKYLVSDGATTFDAYADNVNFSVGTSVYVTIPKGDFNNKKIIIGRNITEGGEYYTYTPPYSKLMDLTGNLIPENRKLELIANSVKDTIKVWEWSFSDHGEDQIAKKLFPAFTRLGIRANFRTWLRQFDIVSGTYGVRMALTYRTKENLQTKEAKNKTKTSADLSENNTIYFDLNSSNFYGNIYNFETFYNQEAVFDLPDNIDKITKIQVEFYQGKDFKNSQGELIPFEDEKNNLMMPNIFADNISINFGYRAEDFKTDTAFLFTRDGYTYNPEFKAVAGEDQPKNWNKKILRLNWIHHNSKKECIVIDSDKRYPQDLKDYSIAIHWYKYELSDGVNDVIAGPFWKEIERKPDEDKFTYPVDPDITKQNEKYLVIIQVQKDNEKNEFYRSEILTLENEIHIPDSGLAATLLYRIKVDEKGYRGNYCIYSPTRALNKESESETRRTLELVSNPRVPDLEELRKAASITWKIPKHQTMIRYPEEGIEYHTPIKGSEKKTDEIVDTKTDENFVLITRKGTEIFYEDNEKNKEFQIETKQVFRIKPYYNPTSTNNTIYCDLMKKGVKYTIQVDLTFGFASTNGTDAVIALTFLEGKNALVKGEKTRIEAELITQNCKREEATFIGKYENQTSSLNSNFKGYEEDGVTTAKEGAESTRQIIDLDYQDKPVILKVTTNYIFNRRPVGLEVYKPLLQLPHESYKKIFYEGPTSIIYDPSGSNPSYYTEPIRALDKNGNEITGIQWSVEKPDGNVFGAKEIRYYPHFDADEEKKFLVPSMFFKNEVIPVIVGRLNGEIILKQPLYIGQNRFGNSAVNSWDGKLTLDEKNGIILSTMIGAGKKNKDNSFSGVLMGDVQIDSGTSSIGLYGFHKGAMSFAFKEDGTAFIGKSGKGRINFDGDTGIIQSADYHYKPVYDSHGKIIGETPIKGMKINLESGRLDSANAAGSIQINPSDSNQLFTIKDSKKILMKIGNGDSNYYLQSSNYNSNGTAGMKINLNTGEITINNGSINLGRDSNGNYAFSVTNDGTLTATKANITGEIHATKGEIGSELITGELKANQIDCSGVITAGKVTVQGIVKATDIDAGNITTGTLSAARIGAKAITTSKIDTGAITASKIAAGAITADSISGLNATIDGRIDAQYIGGQTGYFSSNVTATRFVHTVNNGGYWSYNRGLTSGEFRVGGTTYYIKGGIIVDL